ncbi:unnamed protein product [Oikopleura dioica]|uniref:Uncharacterized protein n=1 Tax=Oikopleura dioica TaxID=34765 RepID=E4YW74_OIKDI|nr:unnamed protein product [Oikopleura dioica]
MRRNYNYHDNYFPSQNSSHPRNEKTSSSAFSSSSQISNDSQSLFPYSQQNHSKIYCPPPAPSSGYLNSSQICQNSQRMPIKMSFRAGPSSSQQFVPAAPYSSQKPQFFPFHEKTRVGSKSRRKSKTIEKI